MEEKREDGKECMRENEKGCGRKEKRYKGVHEGELEGTWKRKEETESEREKRQTGGRIIGRDVEGKRRDTKEYRREN
ncbi:hypothetical protein Pmani_013678 [Petrolisthes manimaculis]|uniref:Uncharacterized protein n=1 Tax=Petrolisthes manimaculis TaxID=1843537 RepID=A0AAE1PX17_9EUCA|nr:hypothetical protein Pmani_013678 [Petrolisthes manimaculis]